MHKQEFLIALRKGLSGLPQKDVEERLAFYGEMIDDRIEEGLTEEEAVNTVGSVSEIVEDISPARTTCQSGTVSRRLKTWEILLLALGCPVWLSLIIAAVAVAVSLYISLWSVVVSLWAVFASLAACGVGLAIGGVIMAITGHTASGLAVVAVGLASAGLSICLFYGCKAATRGIWGLTKKMTIWIKNRFKRKEAV